MRSASEGEGQRAEIIPPGYSIEVLAQPPAGLLPAAPQGWQSARLPRLYMAARQKIIECDKVDECREWERQADAFASYYRQAMDKTLLYTAQRIKLRAIRRCGEILLQDLPTNTVIAKKEGMFPVTIGRAKSFATIPQSVFDEMVEQTPPAGSGELHRLGIDLRYAEYTKAPDNEPEPTPHSERRREADALWQSICNLAQPGRQALGMPISLHEGFLERWNDPDVAYDEQIELTTLWLAYKLLESTFWQLAERIPGTARDLVEGHALIARRLAEMAAAE